VGLQLRGNCRANKIKNLLSFELKSLFYRLTKFFKNVEKNFTFALWAVSAMESRVGGGGFREIQTF
jgi:hypothetical protein